MKNLTAPVLQSGLLTLCLLFAFHGSAQVTFCPPYPRVMDQVFVCLEINASKTKLKLDNRAGLHNPARFVFPAFAFDPGFTISAMTVDFGDGMGAVTIASGGTVTVTYAAPAQYSLVWTMSITKNSDGSVTTWSGTMVFQSNFDPAFTYPVAPPHDVWGGISGDTYTPPAGHGYPAGSPYSLPVAAGGVVNILYANADHQLRKPFILVEGFDPIIGNPAQYSVSNPDGSLLGYGSLRWDVVLTGRNEFFDDDAANPGIPHTPQFALLPGLIAQIQARGYDVVYVDFANAGTYIQTNAERIILANLSNPKPEKSGYFYSCKNTLAISSPSKSMRL